MSSTAECTSIQPFSRSQSTDPTLITPIVDLINLVFDETESDLLIPGHQRTNATEISRFLAAGELHGTFDADGKLAGVVRIFKVDRGAIEIDDTLRTKGEDAAIIAEANNGYKRIEAACMNGQATPQLQRSYRPPSRNNADVWSFGMLSVHPSQRSHGLGRRLVQYSEDEVLKRGGREMEIILLVPAQGPAHAFKDFLRSWYVRIGYKVVDSTVPEAVVPHLEHVFSRPCLFEVSRKTLV